MEIGRGDWIGLVRKHVPDMSDKDCMDLLWTKTSFPVGSLEKIEHQLKQHAEGVVNDV